jgi:hypothetical protein
MRTLRSKVLVASSKEARKHVELCKAVRDLGVKRDEITDEQIRHGAKAYGEGKPDRLVAEIRKRPPHIPPREKTPPPHVDLPPMAVDPKNPRGPR